MSSHNSVTKPVTEWLFVALGFMLIALGVLSAALLFYSSTDFDMSTLATPPPRQASIDGDGEEHYEYRMGENTAKDTWFNHVNTANVVSDKTEYPATAFNEEYYDASDWVNISWEYSETHPIKVIFSDDPATNCGLRSIHNETSLDDIVAGCYNAQYGRTLFIFWGKNTDIADREHALSHEYSHFISHFIYFAALVDATRNGYWTNEASGDVMEQDAECRMKVLWGWETNPFFSTKCTTSDWYEGWLPERIQEAGVL